MSEDTENGGALSANEGKVAAVRLGLAVVGGACLSIGAGMAYLPAGWIVAGVLMFSVGTIGALRG